MQLKKIIFILVLILPLYAYSQPDEEDFEHPKWLKILNQGNKQHKLHAEFDDDIIIIFCDTADSFEIDFSDPEFEDVIEDEEEITVKLNNHTTYYGLIPKSKKLSIYNKVILYPEGYDEKSFKKEKHIPDLPPEKTNPAPVSPIEKKVVKTEAADKKEESKKPIMASEVKSSTKPESFIPGKEKVKIKFNNINKNDVKKWELPIRLPDNTIFKKFEGEDDFKNEISWYGKDDIGNLLPNGIDCNYRLYFEDKNGIQKQSKLFKIKTALNIKKEKKKISIEMQEVLFDKNSSSLCASAKAILDKVIVILKKNKKEIKNINIEGHTDNTGKKDFNLKLSKKRAESVQGFLNKSNIVEKGKIKAKGYGSTKPLYLNDTEVNRNRNRRVKIMINLK